MTNIINQESYLRTSREFPEDVHQLSFEINKTYVDISNAVNSRTIGIFPTNRPAITGESWFFTTVRQQGLRQVYIFGAIPAGGTISIPYKTQGFDRAIRLFGFCKTALPDERPIPYTSTAANSNIDVRLNTPTLTIVISNGAGGPNILSGQIVFEWLGLGDQLSKTV